MIVWRAGFAGRLDHEVAFTPRVVATEDFEQLRVNQHVTFRITRLWAKELGCLDSDDAFIPAKRSPGQLVDFVAAKASHRTQEKDLELLRLG
jgi:hypothetical protein